MINDSVSMGVKLRLKLIICSTPEVAITKISARCATRRWLCWLWLVVECQGKSYETPI